MVKCSKDTGYLSIKEYHHLARAVLYKYGGKKFLKSEDDISYVMYKMMMSDKRFNGLGSRMGYRLSNARFAVKTLCWKKQHPQTISLDATVKTKNQEIKVHSLVGIADMLPEEKLEFSEIVDYIHNSKILTDLEKQLLIKHYIENTPVSDIVKEFQITQQMVSKTLLSAISKLRWKFNE